MVPASPVHSSGFWYPEVSPPSPRTVGPRLDIPASVVEVGSYRNVFNTPAGLRRDWGDVATIDSVMPALVGQHQDVVVVRGPLA